MGVLPERSGFYEWMNAQDYLAWFARLYGARPMRSEIAARLARVGLDGGDRRVIATYSRGMKQRLGLARALLHRPQLLILDEPANGLDPRGRREMHDLLLECNRHDGVGILLYTHSLEDVERLCTRIGILHRGRTVLEGALSELVAAADGAGCYRLHLRAELPSVPLPPNVELIGQQNEWVRVKLNGNRQPDDIWRGLLAAHWPIVAIQPETSPLEDLYLRHTRAEAPA
jgi:ABC-2 type transport system ATP-binding protein